MCTHLFTPPSSCLSLHLPLGDPAGAPIVIIHTSPHSLPTPTLPPPGENVEISPEVMSVLDRVSGGDLRKAITTLQSAVRLKGTPVAAQTLLDVSSSVPPAVTQGLYDACCERSYGKMQAYVQDMVADGYPVWWWGEGGHVRCGWECMGVYFLQTILFYLL